MCKSIVVLEGALTLLLVLLFLTVHATPHVVPHSSLGGSAPSSLLPRENDRSSLGPTATRSCCPLMPRSNTSTFFPSLRPPTINEASPNLDDVLSVELYSLKDAIYDWGTGLRVKGARMYSPLEELPWSFHGGVFADDKVFLIPHSKGSPNNIAVISFHVETKEVEILARWPTDITIPEKGGTLTDKTNHLGFSGAVHVQQEGSTSSSIWLIPHDATRVVKIETNAYPNKMTSFSSFPSALSPTADHDDTTTTTPPPTVVSSTFNTQPRKFLGGCYDGVEFVYMAPATATSIVKINTISGEMFALSEWDSTSGPPNDFNMAKITAPAGAVAFYGAICTAVQRKVANDDDTSSSSSSRLIERKVWLVPHHADRVIVINVCPTSDQQLGRCQHDVLLDLKPQHPQMKSDAGGGFAGGAFDPVNGWVWMVPWSPMAQASSDDTPAPLIKIDVYSPHTIVKVPFPVSINADEIFEGAVFDGNDLYLIPKQTTLGMVVLAGTPTATQEKDGTHHHNGLRMSQTNLATYPSGTIVKEVRGGVYDGRSVWLVAGPNKGRQASSIGLDVLVRISSKNFINSTSSMGCSSPTFDHQTVTAVSIINQNGGSSSGRLSWSHPLRSSPTTPLQLILSNVSTQRLLGDHFTTDKDDQPFSFYGTIFDPKTSAIWVAPTRHLMLRIDMHSGAATAVDMGAAHGSFTTTSCPYRGAIFDGESYLWLVPCLSNTRMRIDTRTGDATVFSLMPVRRQQGTTFYGGTFDGEQVWYAPGSAGQFMAHPSRGHMQNHYPTAHPANMDLPPSSKNYCGAVYDGNRYVYFTPFHHKALARINKVTSDVEFYTQWPADIDPEMAGKTCGGAFAHGSLFMAPHILRDIVMFHGATATMKKIPLGSHASIAPFFTNVEDPKVDALSSWMFFDGGSLYLASDNAQNGVLQLPLVESLTQQKVNSIDLPSDEQVQTIMDSATIIDLTDSFGERAGNISRIAGLVADSQRSIWVIPGVQRARRSLAEWQGVSFPRIVEHNSTIHRVALAEEAKRVKEWGEATTSSSSVAFSKYIVNPLEPHATQGGTTGGAIDPTLPIVPMQPDTLPTISTASSSSIENAALSATRMRPLDDYIVTTPTIEATQTNYPAPPESMRKSYGCVLDYKNGLLWMIPQRKTSVTGLATLEILVMPIDRAAANEDQSPLPSNFITFRPFPASSGSFTTPTLYVWFVGGVMNTKRSLLHLIPTAGNIFNIDTISFTGTWDRRWPASTMKDSGEFIGAAVDNQGALWACPYQGNEATKFPPDGGEPSFVTLRTGNDGTFLGGVVADAFVVFPPYSGKQVARVNTITNTLTFHGNWKNQFGLNEGFISGSTYDWKRTVYMVSLMYRGLLYKFDIFSGTVSAVNYAPFIAPLSFPQGIAAEFQSITTDGDQLFLIPADVRRNILVLRDESNGLLSTDTDGMVVQGNATMTKLDGSVSTQFSWENISWDNQPLTNIDESNSDAHRVLHRLPRLVNFAFQDVVFDGRSIFMGPAYGAHVVRIVNKAEATARHKDRAVNAPSKLAGARSNHFFCGLRVLGSGNNFTLPNLMTIASVSDLGVASDSQLPSFSASLVDHQRQQVWFIPHSSSSLTSFVRYPVALSKSSFKSSVNVETELAPHFAPDTASDVSSLFHSSGVVLDSPRAQLFLLTKRPMLKNEQRLCTYNMNEDTFKSELIPNGARGAANSSFIGMFAVSSGDGEDDQLWLLPSAQRRIGTLTLHPASNESSGNLGVKTSTQISTQYPAFILDGSSADASTSNTRNLFSDAVFVPPTTTAAAGSVWFAPSKASGVLRVRPTSPHTMVLYTSWPEGFVFNAAEKTAFSSILYDAKNNALWLIPHSANTVVKVCAVTGAMTGFLTGFKPINNQNVPLEGAEGSFIYEEPIVRAAFDGRDLWLMGSQSLFRLDTITGESLDSRTLDPTIASFSSAINGDFWPSGTRGFVAGVPPPATASLFADLAYDGVSLWLVPAHAAKLLRLATMNHTETVLNDEAILKNMSSRCPTSTADPPPPTLQPQTPTSSASPTPTASNIPTPTVPINLPPDEKEQTNTTRITESVTTATGISPTGSQTASLTVVEPASASPPPTDTNEPTTPPATTPSKRVVSVTTVLPGGGTTGTVVMTSAGASTAVTSVVTASSVGSSIPRVSGALRMLDCPLSEDDERPSVYELPLQVDLGGKLGYFSGAVLLQTILISFFAVMGKVLNIKKQGLKGLKVIAMALAATLMYFGPFILASSVTVLVHDNSETISVIIVCCSSITVLAVRVFLDRAVFDAPTHIEAVKVNSVRGTVLFEYIPKVATTSDTTTTTSSTSSGSTDNSSSSPTDSEEDERDTPSSPSISFSSTTKINKKLATANTASIQWFLASFLPFFDGCRDFDDKKVRMYGTVEFTSAAVVSMLAGIRPDDGCQKIAWAIAFVSLATLAYLVVIRPYRTRLDTVFTCLVNLLQTALSFCTLVAIEQQDPDHVSITWAEYIMQALVAVFFIQLVVQLAWMWVVTQRRKADAEHLRNDDHDTSSNGRSDDDDEEADESEMLAVQVVTNTNTTAKNNNSSRVLDVPLLHRETTNKKNKARSTQQASNPLLLEETV